MESGERSHPSRTPLASDGDIAIAYETFGDATDPPVPLIMGSARSSISWQEDFCQQLADRSQFVVRFDNRDVGLTPNPDW